MKLLIILRNRFGVYNPSGYQIALPLKQAWFESATNDLHLQFEGYEKINICPADNAIEDEMMVPEDALVFRWWLQRQSLPYEGKVTFQTCTIAENKNAEGLPEPPPEGLYDLVARWKSPNRQRTFNKL